MLTDLARLPFPLGHKLRSRFDVFAMFLRLQITSWHNACYRFRGLMPIQSIQAACRITPPSVSHQSSKVPMRSKTNPGIPLVLCKAHMRFTPRSQSRTISIQTPQPLLP